MNKKGFTLIELLAVIVILGLVMTIAVSSIGNLTNTTKDKMLEEKIRFIEETAILYGQDMKNVVIDSNSKYDGYSCLKINVRELGRNTYLDSDVDGCSFDNENSKCIVDPSNESNYLDDYNVIIYYRNYRIHAKFDKDNNLVCS